DVINPATGQVCGRVSVGSKADVDRAVAAARKAFRSWSKTSRQERLDALSAIVEAFSARVGLLAEAITEEMGAPAWLSQGTQAPIGINHFKTAIGVLEKFEFEEDRGTSRVIKEPIGVCGF